MKTSKRFAAAAEKVRAGRENNAPLALEDACKRVKEAATAKFVESVDLVVRLGIDASKSDQNVRGTVSLPKGTGKTVRVIVIAQGEKVKEAEQAGADTVGGAELVEKIQGGWVEFDIAVATPDMMKDVGKLGKVLGPKGLMPNPKTGTVTFDVGKAVKEFKAGKVEYRNDKGGNVHVSLGKTSFSAEDLAENARAAIAAILRSKPATAKGTYLRGAALSSTMGPGLRLDQASLRQSVS